jgi:hypothetical protein
MPRLTEATKPSAVWCALRDGHIAGYQRLAPQEPYGLWLVVGVPPNEVAAPAKIVKPLVDGVVAALHNHDGTELHVVSERLAIQLPANTPDRIAALLSDERAAILGSRRLLWPHGSSVQWNPADDLCSALDLSVVPSNRWELSGHLMSLAGA